MNGRRSVDELSLAELERLVLLRRREERLRKLRERGISQAPPELPPVEPAPAGTHDELAFLQKPSRRKAQPATTPKPRSRREQFLFLAEILGLVGLAAALVLFIIDLRQINADAATVQAAMLAPAPTPPARAELPGGRPPVTDGAIPAIYQDWIEPQRAQAMIPAGDTTAEQQPSRIVIPKIGVDAPVVQGDDWEALKRGAGHHLGSANPGERGNMVISAHNDIFGEIFRDLNQLEDGDEVQVYDGAGRVHRYRVVSKRIVEPTDVSVLDPTNEPIVTLITCHPYLIDTQRLIVVATLVGA